MEDIPFIVWKEEYSVGHTKIDKQHATLFLLSTSFIKILTNVEAIIICRSPAITGYLLS